MKYEIKNLPDAQKEILVSLEFEELKPYLQKKAKEKGKEIELKGFRKGKVPPEIVQLLIEDNLLGEAAENAIKEIYFNLLKETQLEVLGAPQIEVLKLAPNNPFEFKIKVNILPEIKLPDYKEIASKVQKRKISVEEKEVDETIKWIQKSRAKRFPKEGSSQIGDYVEFVWSSPQIQEGKEHKEGVILGESYLLPEFEKEILGTKPGEEKEFQITFPFNYFNQELAGKKVKIKAKIQKIEKIELPEINDAWARSLGRFENLEELKKSIREGIFQEKEKIESQRTQGEILEKIAEKTEFEVPKILIDLELQRTIDELKETIPQMLGISFEEYLKKINQSEEELQKSLLSEIKEKVKKFLILREIKKKEGIEAKEEEIQEEANKFLSRFTTPEEAQKTIDPQALREYIKERIENEKTLRWLEGFAKKN